MKEFVTLNQKEFNDWADVTFGTGQYKTTTPKMGIELVICHPTQIHGFEIHVYTSVVPETDKSRDKGEDAIRFVLFDRYAGRPVEVAKKVLRVNGDTGVFDRCTERVNELFAVAQKYQDEDRFCKKCRTNRSHTIERTQKASGAKFQGCALFPKCGPDKMQHLAQVYPLKDNPFKQAATTATFQPTLENITPTVQVVQAVQAAPKELNKGDFIYHPIVEDDNELVTTQSFAALRYPFPYFNKVQSGILKSKVPFLDCNMVLGTATSSGKTICAELVIAATLAIVSNNEV
jgi:hypothetical protein